MAEYARNIDKESLENPYFAEALAESEAKRGPE